MRIEIVTSPAEIVTLFSLLKKQEHPLPDVIKITDKDIERLDDLVRRAMSGK